MYTNFLFFFFLIFDGMFTNFLVNGVALLFNRTQPHALLLSQQRYDLSHSLSLFLLPKLPISQKKSSCD